MSDLPSWMCRLNAIPVNSPVNSSVTVSTLRLQLKWRGGKRLRTSEHRLKSRVGVIQLPPLKTCHKATMWYWWKQITRLNKPMS